MDKAFSVMTLELRNENDDERVVLMISIFDAGTDFFCLFQLYQSASASSKVLR